MGLSGRITRLTAGGWLGEPSSMSSRPWLFGVISKEMRITLPFETTCMALLQGNSADTKGSHVEDPGTIGNGLRRSASGRPRAPRNAAGGARSEGWGSVPTVKRAEASSGVVQVSKETVQALRRVLEGAGVEFIPENGSGAGVRLRRVS